MLPRFCLAVGAAALLGSVAGTNDPAFADASCSADRYHVAGSIRQPNSRSIPIRANFSGNLLTKTAGNRRQACRDAVNEALQNLLPALSQRQMEEALCERAERADGRSPGALPRTNTFVRATSLVVESSVEPDIHAMAGLAGIEISCEEARNNAFGSDGAFCNEFLRVARPFRNLMKGLRCTTVSPRGAPAVRARSQEWFDYCVRQRRGVAFELARDFVRQANACMLREHVALIDRTDTRDQVRRVAAYCGRYANYYPAFNRYRNELSALLWGWPLGGRPDTGTTCAIFRPDQRRNVTSAQSRRACMDNETHASTPMSQAVLLHRVAGTLTTSCGSNTTEPQCRASYTYLARQIRFFHHNCQSRIALGGQWLFPDTVQNP